jgi:hypothetical protein
LIIYVDISGWQARGMTYQHTLKGSVMVSGIGRFGLWRKRRRQKVGMPNGLVMGSWVVFGEVISLIEGAGFPMDDELFLSGAVADPIKAHVDGFGALLLDGIVDDTFGAGVVGLNGSGWLWVAEIG